MPFESLCAPRRRRIIVIHNPIAGKRATSQLQAVVKALEARGCHVQVRESTYPNSAQELAAGVATDEFDLVVAAGGDGTVHEVANGLPGGGAPLAIIPLGTTNVLALEIGIPDDPSEIAQVLIEGPARPIHTGFANGRRFLMMVGVGFDSHVLKRTTPTLKKWIGKKAYVWQGIRCFVQCPQSTFQVTIDGKSFEAAAVIVANMRHYGGPNVLAPEASLEAPGYQVCLFRRAGRLNVARYGLALLTGRLPRMPDVDILPGTSIAIEGNDNEPVQADGEIIGRMPVMIDMAPETIEMIFPG